MFNPFAVLKIMPKLVKRMASGEVLAADETTANFGQSRVRLTAKREAGSSEVYAVLTTISSGAHQHFHLSPRELDELTNVARAIQSKVRERKPLDAAEGLGAPNSATRPARAAAPGRAGAGRNASQRILFMVGLLVVAFLVMLLIAKLLERPGVLF
ncbi:MAG: hypothetical protein ABR863_09595 [Roseiarcus sp.]|jgi:hypothetical protein